MAERIEDLNLPNSVVTRLMKDCLPDGVNIGKDARVAVARSASVFILFLTSSANQAALQDKRKTITANDIFKALYDTEFDFFVEPLKESLEEFKRQVLVKKGSKAGKVSEVQPESEVAAEEEEEDDDGEMAVDGS